MTTNTALAPKALPAPKAAPKAADRSAALRERLAKALAGTEYPAADNATAWTALLASIPAVAEAIKASRDGKYGEGKGLVPGAAVMVTPTHVALAMAASGTTKEGGKPTAHAATCRAAAEASRATGGGAVCKAAVVFFMLTSTSVLELLHQTKATDGNGKASGPRYIGRTTVPCPAWAAGYVQGNIRAGRLKPAA